MVRMISLERCVTRLRPELEDRLKKSYLSAWRGDVLLKSYPITRCGFPASQAAMFSTIC